MEPFTSLKSRIVPLPRTDVDTDQIIPARYLKATVKSGLGGALFADWRCVPDGQPDPDFPLNRQVCQGAKILLAEENFGCGSSREHAVWALQDWGIRSVMAVSFADIFRNNAYKNGLLPVELPAEVIADLFAAVERDPWMEVEIDLDVQGVTLPEESAVSFEIDPFTRFTLMNGMDQLDYLLSREAEIADFEARHGGL